MSADFWSRARRRIDVGLRDLRAEMQRFVPRLVIDRDGDYATSVLLVGAGRSGTSWLPNAINYRGDYRYMYEPFNYKRVAVVRHWRGWQYIRPDDTDPRFLEPARQIFSGRVGGRWIDSQNRLVVCHKRLIKDVLITQSTGWVRRQFPKMPIIFLMRHPFAVAMSRLRLGWDPGAAERFFSQPALVEDFIEPFRRAVFGARDVFEQHLFTWCIQNYVPLHQLKPGDVHLTFYERLTMDAPAELARLGTFLGLEFDDRAMERLREPSIQARRFPGGGDRSAVLSGESVVDTWRKHVQPEQRKRGEEILALFGLHEIYSSESMPDPAAAQRLMAANAR